MKKTIIGLVGETGSGKDTVARYLREKHGATLMRFKDPMKETLKLFFEKPSKEDYQWFYNTLNDRFGEEILCKGLEKKIEKTDAPLIVVNGLRMPCDLDFIKGYEDARVLYVTADQRTRWQRVALRGEKSDDDISFEKFQKLDENETEVHIPEIGGKADFTIANEKDLNYLLEETDRFVESLKLGSDDSKEGVDGKSIEEAIE